ncbi:BH0509 family protein [Bacillus infantis]
MNKEKAAERENMISVIEWRTGYSREYLKNLTEAQLEKLYKEKVG